MIPGKTLSARLRPAALLLLGLLWTVHGEESTHDAEPAPDSVEGLHGQFTKAFEERQARKTLTQLVQSRLQKLPPFFRDTVMWCMRLVCALGE